MHTNIIHTQLLHHSLKSKLTLGYSDCVSHYQDWPGEDLFSLEPHDALEERGPGLDDDAFLTLRAVAGQAAAGNK